MLKKFLLSSACFVALSTSTIISANPSYAFDGEDFSTEVVNAAVSIAKGTTLEDQSLSDAAFKTAEMRIVDEISTQMAKAIIRAIPELSGEFTISIMKDRLAQAYAKKVGSLGSSFAGQLAADVIVGIVIDLAADEVRDTFGGEGSFEGEMAAFAVKQTRVAWASKKGPHAAVLESAILSGQQLYRVVELKNQLEDINESNAIGEAIVRGQETVADLRMAYKTSPPSEKIRIEMQIREALTKSLVYNPPGLFSGQKPVPQSEGVIDQFILAMKAADQSKSDVAQALYDRIRNAHPDQIDSYIELANDFIKSNFYDPARWGGSSEDLVNPAKTQRDLMYSAAQLVLDEARINTARLRSLIQEARQLGGVSKLSLAKQNLMIQLAKEIDSSLAPFGSQEILSRILVNYNKYAEKYGVDPIDFSEVIPPPSDDAKVPDPTIVGTTDDQPNKTIGDTVFRKDDPSETDVILDNGTIGPSIPDKTTDIQTKIVEDADEPPPDYTAQIAALKAQRDALIIAEIDAEFIVSESNNRLAVLRYEDLETVNYYLGVVDAEVAELRAELENGPLSPQDAARYQSLLTYQETLEAENDRINDLIEAEELKIENARLAIQETNASLVVNQSGLVGYGFNMTSYVPPTHNPGTPTDWTGYEYVPPPFPGQSPIYDNAYGFLAGGFGGSYNQTFARDMVPVVENGVTKFRFSENSGTGSYVLVPKNERTSDDFSYLSWGTDRAVAVEGSGAGLPYIDQVFWLYGEQTPTSVLEARTGSADFTGNVYGHYYRWPSSGASSIEHNAVTGTLSFSADFASDTITGNGRFNVASSAGNFSETFSLSGSLSDDNTSNVRDVSGTEGGLSYGISSAANIVAALSGPAGSGHMAGSFYGPNGLEAGGSISYFLGDRESAIAGVFTAREELAPTYKGIISSATPYQSGYELTLTEVTSEDRPVDGTILTVSQRDDNSANPLPRVGDTVAVSTYGVFGNNGYSYSDWGKWNGTNESGTTRGYYAVAQETPISTVEMKTGTATYTGLIGGQCTQGCGFPGPTSVSGSISLSADFTTDRVTGSMNMGNDLVSTGSLPIDAGISGNEFSQTEEWVDDLGVSYGINGVFGGPNAEEVVGGVWAHSVYGGDGFAMNGVFIAKQ